jgi:beta-glucosidase
MLNIVGRLPHPAVTGIAMQSRLKIPLLFGQDVLHGFRTTFPIPLAEAASWDLAAIEKSARIAAIEASSAGIHWTFAPMIDIGRDPRWGRVMEGAGEDAFLGSLIAAARVKGFQGKGLGTENAIMACAKHFAGYGAAVGGRDYNSVDMSERMLREVYLPPFKAAADAGVATFMNSFNDLNGIPATGSALLQRTILKGEWDFKGFVLTDWATISEMVTHGYAKDLQEAALKAIMAGCDLDMESRAYIQYLPELVQQGKVPESFIDDAVMRILIKKFEMGLFDNPFRYCNEAKEKQEWNNVAHIDAARDMAKKSMVLLKNDSLHGTKKPILPLSSAHQKIAFIGPLVKEKSANLGFWSFDWPDDSVRIVSLWNGATKAVKDSAYLYYAKGCNLDDSDTSGFAEAIHVASKADVVVLSIGEERWMSGEAKSRSSLRLPGVQELLIKRLASTGKPLVLMISAGRPLVLGEVLPSAHAVVYTWWLGIEAGNAMADVLFGKYNPSGRLPMTFPRSEGQIPIFYNFFNTGRPAKDDSERNYVSAYIDLPNSPQFAFGYGLSFTTFAYGNITLSSHFLEESGKITVRVPVTNIGGMAGKETVQLYLRDMVASVVRPVKELKAFKQIELQQGETKMVEFEITVDDLRFYNHNLQYVAEPGEFEVFIGPNSRDVKKADFTLK